MTDGLFMEIINAFNEYPVSLYCTTRKLKSFVSIEPRWIDCCINSYCVFTGIYKMLDTCSECDKLHQENLKAATHQLLTNN